MGKADLDWRAELVMLWFLKSSFPEPVHRPTISEVKKPRGANQRRGEGDGRRGGF